MTCKVSIIVRCRNEAKHIEKLLDGIQQQVEQSWEIILVDSQSTDGTLEIARRYPVHILSIDPAQFSYGRAVNIGCEAAKGEFIVIVSAHTYPVNQYWLTQLLQPFENRKVALVYGKQRGISTSHYSEQQIFAKWFPDASMPHQSHPFCNNANAAIRRSLWEQFPYNEDLPGLEDIDWAKRVMQQCYQIAYIADAGIIHIHQETWQQTYHRYLREAIAFKAIFPDQTFTAWNFVYCLTTTIFSDYYHACLDRVFWRNVGKIPLFRLMQFLGIYQGYRKQPIVQSLRQILYHARPLNHSSHHSCTVPRNHRFLIIQDYPVPPQN